MPDSTFRRLSLGSARGMVAGCVAGILLAGLPVEASAHATLVSASPAPNDRLASAPGVVELQFSESVNGRLSKVTVRTPDGRSYASSASDSGPARVQLRTNVPGIYRVDWVTVSRLDGHTLRGSYVFGVQVSPGSGGATAPLGPNPADLTVAIFRALEYLALFSAAGGLLLRWLAAREGLDPPIDVRLPVATALLTGIAVVAGETAVAAGSFDPSAAGDYLLGSPPGWARLVRLLAESTALAAALRGSRGVRMSLFAAMVALAAAGHAAASSPGGLAVAVDAGHLAAAAVWAGGILALTWYRLSGRWDAAVGGALMRAFGPWAIAGFGLSVLLGLVRAVEEIASPADLIGTVYSAVLSAKAAAVLAIGVIALLIRRGRPSLVRFEGLLALIVIMATALLAAQPLPPRRAAEADALSRATQASPALPRPGDLTMASEAGSVLVGLTLRPGRPGDNTLFVLLSPLEPASGRLPVDLTIGSRRVSLVECADLCESADVVLAGGEKAVVRISGPGGGVAVFDIPHLRADDGQGLLANLTERMHSLGSYAIEETLRPATAPLESHYEFVAPDRMHLTVGNGFERISIGTRSWTRDGPARAWHSAASDAIDIRQQLWEYQAPSLTAHLLEPRLIEGQTYSVLSFFEGDQGAPIWFRLYVDGGGYVARAEMRARGHFMDRDYGSFNRALQIEPPSG